MDNIQSIQFILPEIILTGFVLIIILVDLLPQIKKDFIAFVTLGGLVSAFFALVLGPVTGKPTIYPTNIFLGMLAYDDFSLLFKIVFVIIAILITLFSAPIIKKWQSGVGEYYALLVSCTLGMCLMAGANNLLMMYLALEFVSITSYILSGLLRKNRKSAEASLKYIIYGAAASGMMIYGISFIYGLTGTTNIAEIGEKITLLIQEGKVGSTFLLITGILTMAGFGYKIAAVPFHMWCPDVYEGAPTPITAFFSVGPKAAGFAMLIRFLLGIFPNSEGFEWKLVISLMCILTMAIGNFSALQQTNLKRLMAYSSISHAGYILLAFSIFSINNIASVMFYVIIYLIMNLGAFLVIILLEEKFGIETVEGCKGLGWKEPALCTMMAIFLFSLTGLPPFAGFVGKLLIFGSTIEGGAFGLTLVVIAVFFSVISLYYYARIVSAMFLAKPKVEEVPISKSAVSLYYNALLWLLTIPTILFGVYWGPLYDFAKSSAQEILRKL